MRAADDTVYIAAGMVLNLIQSRFCLLSSHEVFAETRQHFALAKCSKEVAVFMFKQCVSFSPSHTHTRTGEMLERREKALSSTPVARAVLQTSRARLIEGFVGG